MNADYGKPHGLKQTESGSNGWFRRLQMQYFADADGARFYWQTANTYLAQTERALIEHLRLGGHERLLEVGCGEGGNLKLLGTRPRQVIGVDYSLGKVRWAAQHVSRASFARADATVLPFAGETFDMVLCRDVLHHLETADKQRVIAEMLRVCRDGGQVVVIEPNGVNPIMRLQGLMVEAEQDILKNSLHRLEGLIDRRTCGTARVIWAQPFPIGRILFHYRWGLPRFSHVLAGLVLALEDLIGKLLPSRCSGYIIIMMDKGEPRVQGSPA